MLGFKLCEYSSEQNQPSSVMIIFYFKSYG